MITEMTRGHVCLQLGDKVIKVEGEGLLPVKNQPNYVIYLNSINKWESPYENEDINEETKKRIREAIEVEMGKRGLKVEFE